MNILFYCKYNVTSPPTNGVATLTRMLSQSFENANHNCFLAFYQKAEGKDYPFQEILQLTPHKEESELKFFLKKNKIDIIIIQFKFEKKNFYILDLLSGFKKEWFSGQIIHSINTLPFVEMKGFDLKYLLFLIRKHYPFKNKIKDLIWGISCFLHLPYTVRHVAKRYQFIFDKCDKIVVLSEHYIQHYSSNLKNVMKKIVCIPPPMDIYDETKIPEQREKNVLVVERLSEDYKRVSRAIEIWNRIEKHYNITDWNLFIVGNGPDLKYYEHLVQRHNLKNVFFVGQQDSIPYQKKAEILMNTSAIEGVPMIIIEAKQMKVIPMSFDSYEGVYDLIKDNYNGIIVHDGDITAYAKKLHELMLDNLKRNRLKDNCVDGLEKFSREKILAQWNKLILSSKQMN